MRWFEDLLLGHSPAGHATACGLHADRGRSRRDDVPEPPRAVRRIDRGRSEEGPWASAGDGGAIVDLIGRSEAASRPPAVDAFDAELTRPDDLLGQVDGHGVRRSGGRRGRSDGVHNLCHNRGGAGQEIEASTVDSGERMTTGYQRGDRDGRAPGGAQRRRSDRDCAVLERDGAGRHACGRATGRTVAVSVTAWPTVDGLGAAVRVVVVDARTKIFPVTLKRLVETVLKPGPPTLGPERLKKLVPSPTIACGIAGWPMYPAGGTDAAGSH